MSMRTGHAAPSKHRRVLRGILPRRAASMLSAIDFPHRPRRSKGGGSNLPGTDKRKERGWR